MGGIGQLLYTALYLYSLILIGRLIFEYIRLFSRTFRPKGPVLLLAEFLYSATDPPLRALRRVLPPLRLGRVSLDMSFLVLLLAISLAQRLVLSL